MKTATPKKKITVVVTGHDSWNGPEILYTKEYATKRAAENFCNKFNAKNNLPHASEYYETARLAN
jgi:hypothetical protein